MAKFKAHNSRTIVNGLATDRRPRVFTVPRAQLFVEVVAHLIGATPPRVVTSTMVRGSIPSRTGEEIFIADALNADRAWTTVVDFYSRKVEDFKPLVRELESHNHPVKPMETTRRDVVEKLLHVFHRQLIHVEDIQLAARHQLCLEELERERVAELQRRYEAAIKNAGEARRRRQARRRYIRSLSQNKIG